MVGQLQCKDMPYTLIATIYIYIYMNHSLSRFFMGTIVGYIIYDTLLHKCVCIYIYIDIYIDRLKNEKNRYRFEGPAV